VVPAAGVVGEAMVALVLARCYREKFGGDHIDDVVGALRSYEERIGWRR
jgi:chorismate synthase